MARKSRNLLAGREGLFLLTSLLLACVTWLLSNLSRDYSGVITVPVVAECNIQGHSNVSSNSATVSARCRTTGFRLLRENTRRSRRPVRVHFQRADIRSAGGDRFYIAGNAKNSYLEDFFGDETVVEAFVSDTLFFVFPFENNKTVPVELAGDILYRSQYMASGPIRLVPDSVTVYGDKTRLDNVDHVTTVPINLDDVHDSQHGALRIRSIKGVRMSDGEVSYEVPVSRFVELRSTLPVSVLNVPAGHQLQVFPSQAEVILQCAFPVGRDPFDSIQLYVDYADFASSLSGRCIPRVRNLPSGVLNYRVSPEIFDCIETD